MVKRIIASLVILLGANISVRAGDYTITTSPSCQFDPTTNYRYLPINRDAADFTGITFTISPTVFEGYIDPTSWQWTLTNGTPSSSSSQNPGTVTFGNSAYGNSNPCFVSFTHIGSNSELCSTPTATVYVNVVKPALAFDSAWSSDDTLKTSIVAVLHYAATPNLGTVQQLVPVGGNVNNPYMGRSYEYKVTVAPFNSGAAASDLDVLENSAYTTTFYTGTTKNGSTPGTAGPYQYSQIPGVTAAIDNGAPTNPEFYAFDAPGLPKNATEGAIATLGYTKIVYQVTLTSYPLYQYAAQQDYDLNLVQTKTITVTCSANGANPPIWN